MKKLNYIDLGFHKGQEIGLVLEHYKNYNDKFDLTIYGVEAYEPHFLEVEKKYKNRDRVKLFNYAINNQKGLTALFISKSDKKLGSSLYSTKNGVNPKSVQSVYGYTFSEFISKYIKDFKSSVNVLKLNIEGAELSVYEDLIKNHMRKHIDLFCGHPSHDIEKISELSDKKDRYYSLIKEHDIQLSYLCAEGSHTTDKGKVENKDESINIFEAVS